MNDWIFLRGLVREQRHWGGFVREFETCIADAKVHPLDLPGNGVLNTLRSPLTLLEMVDACRSQLQQQGLAPPYRFVSISMGSMVAVQWAHAYPDEVAGMVLINTSMRPFNHFYQRLRPANYIPILKLLVARATALQWEQAILKMTSHHPGEPVLESWTHLREHFPVSRWNALRQLWAAARFRAPTRKPCAKVLVLVSEQDQLVSADCSQAIARRWDVPIKVHPSAGHDLTLDDGPWVAQQVLLWVDS
jgi:pimeloyl-ACP methyl ester carboxylesterase